MYIAFNCLNSGLGNQGGSRTILHCQRVLKELGHKCDVIATADRFTWFIHPTVLPQIPQGLDCLISTACSTVESTINFKTAKKKAWYIRAHETWHKDYNSDEKMNMLYQYANKQNVIMLVNSEWQQDNLKWLKIDSHIVYQGLDLGLWYKMDTNKEPNKTTIGCLYTPQPRKRWKDFIKLITILGKKHYNYYAFGDKLPPMQELEMLNKFVQRPNVDELRAFYNMCDIWFAPTDSEGLHNPPMEAMLCGCLLVCSNYFRNGMSDYATNNETAIVFKNVGDAADSICYYHNHCDNIFYTNMVNKGIYKVTNKIGTREDNMKKLVNILCQK